MIIKLNMCSSSQSCQNWEFVSKVEDFFPANKDNKFNGKLCEIFWEFVRNLQTIQFKMFKKH